MIAPYDPLKHADPLLTHAEHHITSTGKVCSAELARALNIDLFRASRIIIALDWRGGIADGRAN